MLGTTGSDPFSGVVIESISPSGTSTTAYDHLDRPFRTTDEFGRVTETIYDTRGLVIETRTQATDSSLQPPVSTWLVSQTIYDAAGRAIYTTNSHPEGTPASEVYGTHTIYDDAGRVIATEQLLGLDIDIVGQASSLVLTHIYRLILSLLATKT